MITSFAVATVLGILTSGDPTTQPADASPVCHDAAVLAPSRVTDDEWDQRFADALRRVSEYQALGNYRLAMDLLCPLREEARTRGGREFMLATAAMGRALSFTVSHHDQVGDPAVYLDESIVIARKLDDKSTQAAVLNDVANLHAARGQGDQARIAYLESAKLADAMGDSRMAARVRCNLARIDATAIDDAMAAVERLEPSPEQARLFVALACAIDETDANSPRSEPLYRRAIELAKQFKDDRLASFAWGYLGRHYEVTRQYDSALGATRHARFAAQKSQIDDVLYRWEWQLGRLYWQRGDLIDATAAYRRAVASLSTNNVRDDVALAYAAPVTGGDFRRDVGQIYYGLADLLLQQCDNETDPIKTQELLRAARDAVELFKAAELKNYFQDDCLKLAEASKAQIDQALSDSPGTAVAYIIPLPDRCELLLSFAGAAKSQASEMWRGPRAAVSDKQLAKLALELRAKMEQARNHDYRTPATSLYKLLIAPIKPELERRNIDTLLFVPDGELRQVSPAALYDESNEQFLIEQYAVGLMPGLSLSVSMTGVAGSAADRTDARLLSGGLSKSRTIDVRGESIEFQELKSVPRELDAIAQSYPNRTQEFRNERFVTDNLNRALDGASYSIVHLATHANFDPDVQRTFVVTHDDRPMRMNDLQQMIQPAQFRGQPVDLLTLSACETAAGDDGRSAMGLAGIAIRAGARSALATLWLAHDTATADLVPEFYRQLTSNPRLNKAQALQAAQRQMINDGTYDHPRFWAPFVIIGNWK